MTTMARADPCVILRRRLQNEFVPNDPAVLEHKTFIPTAKVALILSEATVENVLQCGCIACQHHRRISGQHSARRTARRITAPTQKCETGSLVLFALLIYIECPCLITLYLDKNITDHELLNETDVFTAEYVQQIFGRDIDSFLARKFHSVKHRFTVPKFSNGDYQEYPETTILPFVRERPLGRHTETGEIVWEGGFGKVYAFEFMDGYGDFSEFPGIKYFARKELLNPRKERFQWEYQNLKFVKVLEDDHLIKVVKAYKHGGCYNFIFPLAMTNLRHYIRDSHTYPRTQQPLIEHPLWQQALGLARGLHRVLVYEAPNSASGQPMYGYHLDLKPANILVESSGRLVITDFGQSHFLQAAEVTSSRVHGGGGAETYAPPEVDHEQICLNRKFDIWSLGCVFLEIAAFIVKGEAGVRNLDRARILTTPMTSNSDDRFFYHNPSGHGYELKPRIIEQIKSLSMATNAGIERQFIVGFLVLVLRMLRSDPSSRISSGDVCIALSELLKSTHSSHHPPRHLSSTEDQLRVSWEESRNSGAMFGSELLRGFQPITFITDRYPDSGHLYLSQENDILCLHSRDSASSRLVLQADRSALRLVPEYALCCPAMGYFNDATLKILSNSAEGFKPICSFDLNKTIEAATTLQEILTGQTVVTSRKIKSATLAQKQKSGMSKRLSLDKSYVDVFRALGHVSAVQLWRETQHGDIAAMAKIDRRPRRRSSGSASQQPCYRRVVVYFEYCIIIMRLAKNLRLDRSSGQGDSPTTVTFIPTNKKVDKYFSVSLLRANSRHDRPSLPLVNRQLEAMEEICRVECSALSLDFYSAEEAKAFCNKYRLVKREWAEDYDRLEALQQRIGFDYIAPKY